MRKTTEQTGQGTQEEMDFVLLARADAITERVLEEVAAGIAELEGGRGRAIQLLDVQPSILTETLTPRRTYASKERQFQLRWFSRLLHAFRPARRLSTARALLELLGIETNLRIRSLEQRNRDLEEALLSFGEQGRKKLEQVPP